MRYVNAERRARQFTLEEPDKIRWSYVPRRTAFGEGWYVAKIDDSPRGRSRIVGRIYV